MSNLQPSAAAVNPRDTWGKVLPFARPEGRPMARASGPRPTSPAGAMPRPVATVPAWMPACKAVA